MNFSRRGLLIAAGAGAGAGLAPANAVSAQNGTDRLVDARDLGVTPDMAADQSMTLQAAVDSAAQSGGGLYLPPGVYRARNLRINRPVQLHGTPGRTVLRHTGGSLLSIADVADVTLFGLTFDGALEPVRASGLVTASDCARLHMEQCQVLSSSLSGIALNRCGGRIVSNTIADALKTAIFSLDATGLEISGNRVHDCRNNGIQVWRSARGEDGTIVTHNRIERIAAADGGSGQNGNGINIFRAGNVIAAQNRITDCAFSAVRSNAGSACQILGNSCARLGEVALYAEFGFEGAVISGNVIETAASGISITNFNDGGRLAVCANNIVRDLFIRDGEEDRRGVGISAEADTVIEGNVVENAAVEGIAL
ncbi:MAG: TIGR03808 family TAT-translocated repetitive protein, partial [Hyphomicrobiales bacterium]